MTSAPVGQSGAAELETIRRRRAELREAFDLLERALAMAATGAWHDTVAQAVTRIRGDLAVHVTATEGPDGLHDAVRVAAPHLTHAVTSLVADHTVLAAELAALSTLLDQRSDPGPQEVTEIRELATRFLAHLARHRQRTADIVYDAFQTDLGGGD